MLNCFEAHDANNKGTVNFEEFKAGLKDFGLTNLRDYHLVTLYRIYKKADHKDVIIMPGKRGSILASARSGSTKGNKNVHFNSTKEEPKIVGQLIGEHSKEPKIVGQLIGEHSRAPQNVRGQRLDSPTHNDTPKAQRDLEQMVALQGG